MCCAAFEPTLTSFITPSWLWPALPDASDSIWLGLVPSCGMGGLGCCQAWGGLQAAWAFRKPACPGAADISQGAKTSKDPQRPCFLTPPPDTCLSFDHKRKSIQLQWQLVSEAVKDSSCATACAQVRSWEEPYLCWNVPRPPSHPGLSTTAAKQKCQRSPTKPLGCWCRRITLRMGMPQSSHSVVGDTWRNHSAWTEVSWWMYVQWKLWI